MERVDDLVGKVVDKAELRSVDKAFASSVVEDVLRENNSIYEAWEQKGFDDRAREYKELVSEARRKLRDVYGVFLTEPLSSQDKSSYLQRAKDGEDVREEVMERHLSTKERLPHYPYLFDHIDTEFGDIDSVIDLGCGYNPIAFSWLNDHLEIDMIDISGEELSFVSSLLNHYSTTSNTHIIDLSNPENLSELRESGKFDVAVCFKLFDSLETKTQGITEDIIKTLFNITKKGIITSFSKRTVSGRYTIDADRDWFHTAIESVNGETQIVESINETFYLTSWKKR